MKTKLKTIALTAIMLTATLSIITFVACNKKNETVGMISQTVQNQGIVYQKNVPDRSAYIAEFEKKIQSMDKSDEFLTVDNANCFLFDILNYDFGDIQYNKKAMSYETTTYTVNVSNGVINLSDFADLYRQISAHVYDYYHSLNLVNPHFYYIFPKIEAFEANANQATVTVETALSSGVPVRDMNFDDTLCDYFPADSTYDWPEAADTLQFYFNLQCPSCQFSNPGRYYFTTPVPHIFFYWNHPEIFYCGSCVISQTYLNGDEMCALLNDYLDMAADYAMEHEGLCVMSSVITAGSGLKVDNEPVPIYHNVTVYYSTITTGPTGPNL